MNELLLRKAQQGSPEAFESLMAELESLVWRVCWHYTGNRENAADCGQEAMVKIWKNLDSFRFDCAFETWVYRICANCCLDFLRREKRNAHLPMEPLAEQGFDPPDPEPGPESTAIRRDELARLREAIAGLPEDQRDALVLTQLDGRSYEEAARLLSVHAGTVKSRVSRAREKLKQLFAPEGELSSPAGVQKDKALPPRGTAPGGKQERRERS